MRGVTLVLVWFVATALAGGVTWTAVAWSEKESVGGVDLQRPLTEAAVRRNLSELQTLKPPTAAPTPAPRRSASHAPTRRTDAHQSATPTPALQTRSWQTAGGSVAVRCRANHLELLYAAPANGWAYHLGQATTSSLTVLFTRPQAVSTLQARCAGNAPIEVSATSPRPMPPPDSESGD